MFLLYGVIFFGIDILQIDDEAFRSQVLAVFHQTALHILTVLHHRSAGQQTLIFL